MDVFGNFAGRFFLDLKPILDWSLNHWVVTVFVLALMIYGAGRQRRVNHHHRLIRR